MDNFIIYGLIDPITNQVRYVGKSSIGLERPKQHSLSCNLKGKNRKNNWIKSLKKINLIPIIKTIEICSSEEELDQKEIYWISFYRKIDKKLTNITDGGTGGNTKQSFKKWKPLLSMNLISGEIKEYDYIWQTLEDGFSPTKVVMVCKRKRYTHKGHTFWYKNECPQTINKKTIVPIEVVDKKNGKKLNFKSIKEAASALKMDRSHISNCLSRKINHRKYFFNRIEII